MDGIEKREPLKVQQQDTQRTGFVKIILLFLFVFLFILLISPILYKIITIFFESYGGPISFLRNDMILLTFFLILPAFLAYFLSLFSKKRYSFLISFIIISILMNIFFIFNMGERDFFTTILEPDQIRIQLANMYFGAYLVALYIFISLFVIQFLIFWLLKFLINKISIKLLLIMIVLLILILSFLTFSISKEINKKEIEIDKKHESLEEVRKKIAEIENINEIADYCKSFGDETFFTVPYITINDDKGNDISKPKMEVVRRDVIRYGEIEDGRDYFFSSFCVEFAFDIIESDNVKVFCSRLPKFNMKCEREISKSEKILLKRELEVRLIDLSESSILNARQYCFDPNIRFDPETFQDRCLLVLVNLLEEKNLKSDFQKKLCDEIKNPPHGNPFSIGESKMCSDIKRRHG